MQNYLIPAKFNGKQLSIIEHSGKRWLTAEQIGRCLGYADGNARDGILKIYERHSDEFTEADSTTVKLTAVDGKLREMRVFSETGCSKLGFFANTPKSKEFRHWAAQALVGQAPVVAAPVLDVSGRRGITRRIERQVFELFVSGLMQRQIAKELGISPASVNLLLRAKYQFAYWAGAPECTPELIAAVAARHLVVEQEKMLAAQERIMQTFCSSANNQQLANALDTIGQQLALPVLSGGAA